MRPAIRNRGTVLRILLYVAFTMVMIGAVVIGVQSARLDAATAEVDYLRLRLHAELGLAELRDDAIQLHRTLHDSESAYIRSLYAKFERVALRAYIKRVNPRAMVDHIAESIQTCAQRYEVEPQLVLGVMQQESHFNHMAVGGAGERGLMQLTFTTATELGVNWNKAFDIETNVCAGAKYLAGLVARFGAPEKAAHHYNGGGDPLYAMRISRLLLQISREFPRSELTAQQHMILTSLVRKQVEEPPVQPDRF